MKDDVALIEFVSMLKEVQKCCCNYFRGEHIYLLNRRLHIVIRDEV